MKLVTGRFYKSLNIVLLIFLSLIVAFVILYSPDVIKDDSWTLTVEGGNVHYTDETLSVSSVYTKVRKADGIAHRYLDCKISSGAYLRYEVNQADANRKALGQSQGTAFLVGIPSQVAPIPTTCKVAIEVKYCIFNLGSVCLNYSPEYNESKEFRLETRPAAAVPNEARNSVSTSSQSSEVTNQSNAGNSNAGSTTTNNTTTNNTTNNNTTAPTPKDEGLIPDNFPILGGIL